MQNLEISPKALQVINLVKNAVSKSVTGVSFFSIKNYTNLSGEVSNQLINVGINYEKSKQKDIEFLENINLSEYDFKSPIDLLQQAKAELIAAFIKPNENMSNAQKNAFTIIFPGVEVHNENGLLYIYGYGVSKTILVKGEYKDKKSKPLTIAKDELRKLLKTSHFRKFGIEIGNELKANGETIEI
jgi:hypothetical protein